MLDAREIDVVVENGLLRPQQPLGLPEHTRLVIAIKRVTPTPQDRENARPELHRIRECGLFRTDGGRLTRDELHERD